MNDFSRGLGLLAAVVVAAGASADPMRPSDFVPEVVVENPDARDRDFTLYGVMRRHATWVANVNNKWLGPGDRVGNARVASVSANSVTLYSEERGRIVLTIERKDIKRVAN